MMLQRKIQYMGVTSFNHSTLTHSASTWCYNARFSTWVSHHSIIQHTLCQYMMLQCKIQYMGVSFNHSTCTLPVHDATMQNAVHGCIIQSFNMHSASTWCYNAKFSTWVYHSIIQHALCQYMMLQCKIQYMGVSFKNSTCTLPVHDATMQNSVHGCIISSFITRSASTCCYKHKLQYMSVSHYHHVVMVNCQYGIWFFSPVLP